MEATKIVLPCGVGLQEKVVLDNDNNGHSKDVTSAGCGLKFFSFLGLGLLWVLDIGVVV